LYKMTMLTMNWVMMMMVQWKKALHQANFLIAMNWRTMSKRLLMFLVKMIIRRHIGQKVLDIWFLSFTAINVFLEKKKHIRSFIYSRGHIYNDPWDSHCKDSVSVLLCTRLAQLYQAL
uniref:Secreted protein n=1 Tax=Gongylonema pulchrum TaxID=637853 RepID=A0A183DEG7_9BILA